MSRYNTIGSHKTSVYDSGAFTCVKYHDTEVVRFSSRFVILNSGGWNTRMTKLRMNQTANQHGLGFSVYQQKHVWYVTVDGHDKPYIFDDGFTLYRESGSGQWSVLRVADPTDFAMADYRDEFVHLYERNADGSPLRARVNGKCKTWKTRPGHFRLPMKYGFRTCFAITHEDMWRERVWCVVEHPAPKCTDETEPCHV